MDSGHGVTLHLTSFALIDSHCVDSLFKPANPKKQNEAITEDFL